ncbi:MAG: hypothetical protein Q4B55_06965, partial [Lachnospiraceae bacterium]|nr:hypothetical protein [Lachnospiraceae bacterium]
ERLTSLSAFLLPVPAMQGQSRRGKDSPPRCSFSPNDQQKLIIGRKPCIDLRAGSHHARLSASDPASQDRWAHFTQKNSAGNTGAAIILVSIGSDQ